MPIPFDPSSVIDLADKLGIIQTVKDKLLRQPQTAADKLVTVLAELSKIYAALETKLVRYLSLSFDPPKGMAERAVLLTLEGGQLRLRASESRGHCHKIWNIYHQYLRRWFHDVLSPDEAASMENLFQRLGYADSQMELAIQNLTDWITSAAQETLDLVDAGKHIEANQRIKAARKEVQVARQAISQAMNGLVQLQGEFIAISGTS